MEIEILVRLSSSMLSATRCKQGPLAVRKIALQNLIAWASFTQFTVGCQKI